MVKMLESKVVKVVEDPESEVNDKLELGPEVVAELLSLQKQIFPQPTEVINLPIETLVDLPTKPTLELVPSLTVMRASFFFRSPDMYDLLQIFLQKTG